MRVVFYGGVEGGTGSCFLLEAENKQNPKGELLEL
jgi:hypothetical protein